MTSVIVIDDNKDIVNSMSELLEIYGIDVDPECKDCEEDNIEIFIGSQADRKFLRQIKKSIPKVDILIDDGGHRMQQQINTFEFLKKLIYPPICKIAKVLLFSIYHLRLFSFIIDLTSSVRV